MVYHDHHHFEMDKFLHSKMNKIYIYQALSTFAKSLIGIFVPVYLYKSGFSLIEIILYNLGLSMVYLLLIPIVVKVIKQIGFKYTLLLSIPFYLLQILVLNYITLNKIFFNLSWVFYGFYCAFFWLTFHSEVALNGSTKHRSSQMGTLQIITSIVGTIAPIIGGFVLNTYNYFYLFAISSTLILIGIVPLLLSQDIKTKYYDFNYKDYFRIIKSKKNTNSKRAFAFEGFNNILLLTLWPIVIFQLLNENYFNFGALVTVISFISVVSILYLKSYFDKKNKSLILKKTSKYLSVSWFFKSIILFFGLIFIFMIESIAKLIWNIFQILFTSIFYNNAKKVGYMDYIIMRELYIHMAKFFFGIVLIIIFFIYGQNIPILTSIVFSGTVIALGLGMLKEEV